MENKPQIVILDGYSVNPGDLSWAELEKIGGLTIYERTSPSDVVSRTKGAEIILTNKVKIGNEEIDNLPSLKFICVMATGYNNIDTEYARSKGITVSNVSGYSSFSVAQHVFALLFAALNKVESYSKDVHVQKWAISEDFTFYDQPIRNINGLNFGIIGYGDIGRKVGEIAKAFGMNILIYNRSKVDNKIGFAQVSKEDLFKQSDVISLHAPLNKDSENIINSKSLDLMKHNSILINTARGGLINESDLLKYLKSNNEMIACLDVLSQEPPPKNHPLTSLKNCIVTPHQAWVGDKARQTLVNGIVENVKSFLADQPINVVN